MRIIDHHQFQHKAKALRPWVRYSLIGLAVAAGLFLLSNGVVWAMYRGKVLPNYRLGTAEVGGTSFAELHTRLSNNALLPQQVTLTAGTATAKLAPADIGMHADAAASTAALKKSRPVLPVLSLFTHHTVALTMRVDAGQYAAGAAKVGAAFNKPAIPNHVVFNGQAFVVAAPSDGLLVNGTTLQSLLKKKLQQGISTVAVPTAVAKAPAPADLNGEVQKLQKQLGLKVSFVYGGKTTTPAVNDIGQWYAPEGQTMVLSDNLMGAYLDGITPGSANRSDLLLAVRYALAKNQVLNFAVVPKGSVTRTYCTATRGVSEVALDEMIGKLAASYADTRGWNAGGKIAFAHVASGCEYTVWLSSAAQMTSFGSICDNYYNCQVGSSVVVNNDRWTQATPPWNATGASLEDYRTLIIDHETGHRLGFYDNPTCPAAGGPAPVMMQQSIDLQGCVFNRWPTPVELSAVLAKNGL
ncbi:MAG: DUF3152 domain-containing protein [Candidatus Saccharimonadales bacterium]